MFDYGKLHERGKGETHQSGLVWRSFWSGSMKMVPVPGNGCFTSHVIVERAMKASGGHVHIRFDVIEKSLKLGSESVATSQLSSKHDITPRFNTG